MTDRHDEREDNIALLIDADNASPEHLDEVLLVLGELGAINVRRAYGNWAKASLKGWGNLTGIHSIVPMQQFDVAKGKSATDMRMTIDAMDLLYRGHVDGFGIMSSDSDFLPLAQRIREESLEVYGFGTEKTPLPVVHTTNWEPKVEPTRGRSPGWVKTLLTNVPGVFSDSTMKPSRTQATKVKPPIRLMSAVRLLVPRSLTSCPCSRSQAASSSLRTYPAWSAARAMRIRTP